MLTWRDNPAIPLAESEHHYRTVHTAKALASMGERPDGGPRAYVQSRVVRSVAHDFNDPVPHDAQPAFDRCVELYYDDPADAERLLGPKDQAMFDDQVNFMLVDVPGSLMVYELVEEIPLQRDFRMAEPDDRLTGTVAELLARVSARRFGDLAELLTDDAIFEVPYAGLEVRGRDDFCDTFATKVAGMFDPFTFEILATHPGRDPGNLVVEYRSTGTLTATGQPYANQYVGIFAGREGRVSLWREYFNPVALTRPADEEA